MNLSKVEKKHLRRALLLSIDYDEALIDAHRVAWSKRKQGVKVIPPEYRTLVTNRRRCIAAFKKLLGRLKDSPGLPK